MTDLEVIVQSVLAAPASTLVSPIFDSVFPTLLIKVRLPGYSASGTAQIQFNGDTGTTAYAWSVSENFAAPTTAISGTASGLQLCQTANIPLTEIQLWVSNINGIEHGVIWLGAGGVIDASAAPKIIQGSGMWNNSSPITQIQLNSGAVNMNAGTGLAIIGVRP